MFVVVMMKSKTPHRTPDEALGKKAVWSYGLFLLRHFVKRKGGKRKPDLKYNSALVNSVPWYMTGCIVGWTYRAVLHPFRGIWKRKNGRKKKCGKKSMTL